MNRKRVVKIEGIVDAKNAINANNVGWAIKPLCQGNEELLPFPLESLPAVVRDYVINVAEYTQTHPDMAAMLVLGALAICTQSRYVIEGKPGYIEPLNLYIAVFAKPGERKSSVMHLMTKDIYQYCIDNDVRLIADDCTPEALAQLMAQNSGTMALVSSEGGMMDQMAGRYSGQPNIDVYLKAHCGDPLYVDRVGRKPDVIANPTLTIIMASQPDVLNKIMANDTFSGRGLLARFLFAQPPSRVGNRVFDAPKIDSHADEKYRSLITSLLNRRELGQRSVLRLSKEAVALLTNHFSEHESYLAGDGQVIVEWAAKYIGEVLRISGLLHLADGKDHETLVSDETFAAAIRIGQYLLCQAECAFGSIGESRTKAQAQIIIAKIRQNNFRSGKRRELYAICRIQQFNSAKEMQPALELLEDYGYIRMQAGKYLGVGRKPDMEIWVNPVVFEKKE